MSQAFSVPQCSGEDERSRLRIKPVEIVRFERSGSMPRNFLELFDFVLSPLVVVGFIVASPASSWSLAGVGRAYSGRGPLCWDVAEVTFVEGLPSKTSPGRPYFRLGGTDARERFGGRAERSRARRIS